MQKTSGFGYTGILALLVYEWLTAHGYGNLSPIFDEIIKILIGGGSAILLHAAQPTLFMKEVKFQISGSDRS